ncbi:MAG: fibronectin type III domain-containing protein, partial [Actinobacteria bacterium]|nr:fibronectin type III domain-containing protein [Actinomycetota bacterium]
APTVEWTRPPADDPVLRENAPIAATISTEKNDQSITKVEFELVQPVVEGDDCFVKVPDEQKAPKLSEESSSTVKVEFDVAFPCNGVYELKAHVSYVDQILVVTVPPRTELADPPLRFEVIIPPAQVSGLKATYDEASKEVRLSWDPNGETDLVGYRVERNPPGPAGFEKVADLGKGQNSFVDKGIDAEHRYQVVAVREGPRGPVAGKPSPVVTVGPDTPEPTVAKVTPTTRGTTATTRSGSGGNRPSVRRRTATTVDTGFSRDLPFDPSETTTSQAPPPPPSTEPEGQAAVLAEFDDDDGDDRRATLVPIAGGLALLMSAVHMRLLSKRVGEDDIPILPGG